MWVSCPDVSKKKKKYSHFFVGLLDMFFGLKENNVCECSFMGQLSTVCDKTVENVEWIFPCM